MITAIALILKQFIISFFFFFFFFCNISQLNRFVRVSNHMTDFNTRNKILTAKLLKQGYWCH